MIAKEGMNIILPLWITAIILIALSPYVESVVFLICGLVWLLAALFTTYFFRDPKRTPPQGDGLIVSPGDGKVILVDSVTGDDGSKETLVSIFLSVFNVHVNRTPISGQVVRVDHKPGKFLKAFEREAVTQNERTEIVIDSPKGRVKFAQVAGIIARRIVCYLRESEEVVCGQRFGLIRFGSRVDIYLGENVELKVKVGDKVRGGESVIGSFK